jgi:hypothetical protein
MVVAKPNAAGGDGGEEMSAARREFFANRAAAQQIKAKVEAYERGGSRRGQRSAASNGSGMEVAIGGGGGSHPIGEYRHQARRQHGHAHQESHIDEGRALSGEERIAQVKAQRRREQELEKAEKERQLQLAYEETRRERMRIEALRKSNAESPAREVAGGGRGGTGNDDHVAQQEYDQEVSHYERQRRKELQREEENRKHEQLLREARAPRRRRSQEGVAFSIDFNDDGGGDSGVITVNNGSDRQGGKAKPQAQDVYDGPSDQFRSRSNSEVSDSEASTSTNSTAPRQRKSWGAPIAPPRRPLGLENMDEVSEVPDGTAVRKLYGTSQAQEVEEDEEAVLKCLEARNGREEAARIHAKEVFRKLREQKRREARLSTGNAIKKTPERADPRPPTRPPPIKSGESPPSVPRKKSNTRLLEKPVNSDLPSLTAARNQVMKKPVGGEQQEEVVDSDVGSVRSSRHSSPSTNLARLNDVMGQVAKAQEEVAKVLADAREGSNKGGPRGSRGSLEQLEQLEASSTPPRGEGGDYSTGRSTSSTQKTTVRNSYGRTGQRLSLGDDEIFAYSSGDDSEEAANHERELEKTLDSWLSKETIKSKKSEKNLLKSMKKGDSLKSMRSGSMKDIDLSQSSKAAKLQSDESSVLNIRDAKVVSEAKSSPRVDNPTLGASMKSVARDNCESREFQDQENCDEDDANEAFDDDEEENNDDAEDDEDGEVAGLQCLLAKALLSDNDSTKRKGDGNSVRSNRDDISL